MQYGFNSYFAPTNPSCRPCQMDCNTVSTELSMFQTFDNHGAPDINPPSPILLPSQPLHLRRNIRHREQIPRPSNTSRHPRIAKEPKNDIDLAAILGIRPNLYRCGLGALPVYQRHRAQSYGAVDQRGGRPGRNGTDWAEYQGWGQDLCRFWVTWGRK